MSHGCLGWVASMVIVTWRKAFGFALLQLVPIGILAMVGHINAGASDLDGASIGPAGCTLALEDSLHLSCIDLE